MSGHQPSGYTDPRVDTVTPDEVACGSAVGAGVGLTVNGVHAINEVHADAIRRMHAEQARFAPAARPIPLPKLLAAMTQLTSRAYALRTIQWDPATGPTQCDPFPPSDVDMRMAAVAADLRSALSGLDRLRRLTTDPADALAPGAGGRPAGTREVPAGASSPGVAVYDGPLDMSPEHDPTDHSYCAVIGHAACRDRGACPVFPAVASFALTAAKRWSW